MSEYGEPLTEREKEILQLVATGVTNREVAFRLDISINTVKVHLRNVFTKLGAESRTEATMIAVQEGWVHIEGTQESEPEEAVKDGSPTSLVAPRPPLPWRKRIMLIIAPLLVVTGIALSWPSATPQEGNGTDSPFEQRQVVILPQAKDLTWHEHAQMPTRRAHLGLAAVEGRIFAIAGQSPEGVTGVVQIYSPTKDIWAYGSDKPTPVIDVSAATIGTEVYVPGGCDNAGSPVQTVEVYDTVTDAWRQVSPLPKPLCAYALATMDEKLHLFGGWDGTQYVANAYIYDPETDLWTEMAPMPLPRGFASAAALEDYIYVVGGYDGEMELSTCAVHKPREDSWSTCAPLAVGRGGLGLVNLRDNLYAIGGGGWSSYLGFNERYNPSDDTWSAIETPLVEEWRSPGVVVIENTIYAIGGWSDGLLSLNQTYNPLPFHVYIPVSQK